MPTKPTTSSTKAASKKVLPAFIFAAAINQTLVAQAVRVYLKNQRQGSKATKTRGMVTGSTRKIYRQKGTGRARHGDRQAPIFVGGGIAHGPTGRENYTSRLNKTQKIIALKSALTTKSKDKKIIILDKLDKLNPKTKSAHQLITKTIPQPQSSLLLVSLPIDTLRAFRNLPYLTITSPAKLTTYEVVTNDYIAITPEAISSLATRLKN